MTARVDFTKVDYQNWRNLVFRAAATVDLIGEHPVSSVIHPAGLPIATSMIMEVATTT